MWQRIAPDARLRALPDGLLQPPKSKMDFQNHAKGLRNFFLFLIVAAFALQVETANAQQRTWTDVSGTYKLEAELSGVTQTDNGLQAELIMPDGKRMAILLSKLSEADAQLAKNRYDEAMKLEASSNADPDNAAPVAIGDSSDVPGKVTKSRGLPEDSIVSRPLNAPISTAIDRMDNRNTTNVKFDPATAIRLEREIARDEKGRPTENPVYLVEVDDRELEFLSANIRVLVDTIKSKKSPIDTKRRAIEKLKDVWPQGRHLGLLKVLVNTLSHEDKFLRLASMDLLANHDSDQSLIYIFARIDDISFDVRWRTYEILTQLRDPRIIPELCERLEGPDRTKAANVLQVFGSTSAQLVNEWVKEDANEKVLLNVCHLLGNIGEESSAKVLSKLGSHESLLVRAQAKNSIKQINRRLEQRASNLPMRR